MSWESNNPKQLKRILNTYEEIQLKFEVKSNQKISIADLIVLGGCVAIENAATKAGYDVLVPFTPGRMDASAYETNIKGMAVLEPIADCFRNYQKANYTLTAEQLLIDKSQLLTLTAPEMTVLIGGMRVLNCNYNNSSIGVLTETPGLLNNNYFKNLCSMDYDWKAKSEKAVEF